jgi:hypothetical protein
MDSLTFAYAEELLGQEYINHRHLLPEYPSYAANAGSGCNDVMGIVSTGEGV